MVGLTHNERCFITRASDVAPNSPDLNPVDCAVWGALQQQLYHNRKFPTVDQLKQAIVEEWNKLSQCFIDTALTNGVVVLLMLYSSRVDTLSTFKLSEYTHTTHTTVIRLCGICPGKPG